MSWSINYLETFAPVPKMDSVWLVLSLVTSSSWEVHEIGVKKYFLHGDFNEEIYKEQPLGFYQDDPSLVCHLKKSLYGFKQAPWAWYENMDNFLLSFSFLKC